MSQDAREQARHNASVMMAYAEGKEIQTWDGESWVFPGDKPVWNFAMRSYRVKPEERKPMRGVMWKHPNLTHLCAHHGCSADHVAELNGWEFVTVMEVLPETETE